MATLAACSSDSGDGATTSANSTSTIAGAPSPASADPAAITTIAAPATTVAAVIDTTPTTVAETTTTTAPATTTTIALVTEGALVLVANAAAVPGAATALTAALQGLGYSVKEATDAAGYEESLDASKIYFLPVAEAAAQSLGLVMQINSVTRMPTPAPILEAQIGLGDATILLMLGRDLAGKSIPGFTGR